MSKAALIRGVGSHNGGAELLLKATADRCRDMHLVPVADVRRTSRDVRKKWSAEGYLSVPRLGKVRSLGWDAVPRRVAARVGLASDRHLAAVLDASGFALGDQWSPHHLPMSIAQHRKWKTRGVPIIYLPQAFGPFEKAENASLTRELLSTADLIYARDRESFEHLVQLLGNDAKIGLCPDITVALSAPNAPSESSRSGRVAIVPNINLTKRANDSDALDRYAHSLVTSYRNALDAGLEPILLVHSSDGDPDVIVKCREILPSVRSVQPADGLQAKALISGCSGVIAGRYHAVVSALSTGVPVIAHSWSHKYQALLDDFDCSEWMADAFDGGASLDQLLTAMADAPALERIRLAGDRQRELIENLWKEIGQIMP